MQQDNQKIILPKGYDSNPFNIIALPGDGIGPEVIEQAMLILKTVEIITGTNFTITTIPCGGKYYLENQIEWPNGSLEHCQNADAILLGAIGYSSNGQTVMTIPGKPYQDTKIAGYAAVIGNRQNLELYANVRPVKLFPGIRHKISGKYKSIWTTEEVDFVIVRENTEDAYTGRYVQHDNQINTPIQISRAATERIARFAFQLAQKRNKQCKVTCVDKSNVIKSHEFFRKIITEIWNNEFSTTVRLEFAYADAFALSQIQEPKRYDVVVAPNFVGDIISDAASLLQGGLGVAPSANIGENHAMFEPVHGSALDLVGTNHANPIATILSVAMMIEWLGNRYEKPVLSNIAPLIEQAIINTIKNGVLTPDLTEIENATSCQIVGQTINKNLQQILAEHNSPEFKKKTTKGKALIIWDKNVQNKKMDFIDTDQITPASYCISESLEQIDKWWKAGAFKYLEPKFSARVHAGETFLVVGNHFAIGSSREMSPAGLKAIAEEAGLELAIICGEHIGDIFLKNAINLGIPIIQNPAAVFDAQDNDEFELRANALVNLTQNKSYNLSPLTEQEKIIQAHGGIFHFGQKEFYASKNSEKKIEWPDSNLAKNMTITEQILYAHRVDKDASIKPGNILKLWADLLPASEVSAPFAIYTFNKITNCKSNPINAAIICDHFVFTDVLENKKQLIISQEFAKLHEIKKPFFGKAGDGIFHIYFPEQGLIHPGGIYAGADSHSRTYGAYGAIGIGVGSTTLGFGWATGYINFDIPKQCRVILKGKLSPWTTGKDVALSLLKRWDDNRFKNMAIEFVDADLNLPTHYRHTICNMMAEAEVISSLFIPDTITYDWFGKRNINLPFPPLTVGENAKYVCEELINLGDIKPQVATPFQPQNSVNANELSRKHIKINKAFIGSCTNGNYEDILEAAAILYISYNKYNIKHVHEGVSLIIFPGSTEIRRKMDIPEGKLGGMSAIQLLELFGGEIRESWCGVCIGQGIDALKPGDKAITTFNRNWKNRNGLDCENYLASPLIVAASAIAGYICTPDDIGI
jgi:3-isopropylmalate dehydrogenase